jgi:hypothetical protein
MAGTLVPPWYEQPPLRQEDLLLATFVWGFSLALSIFAFAKAAQQTRRSWLRTHRVTAYIFMIWLEWVVCIIVSANSWLFLVNVIPARYVTSHCLSPFTPRLLLTRLAVVSGISRVCVSSPVYFSQFVDSRVGIR